MKKIITTVITVAFAGSTMAQTSTPVDTSWKKVVWGQLTSIR